MTFDQVLEAAHELTPAQKSVLMRILASDLEASDAAITREQLITELDLLRQTHMFDKTDSLYGKYARNKADVSYEELGEYRSAIN